MPEARSPESAGSSVEALRVDLAACFRLIALFGWDDLVYTHASARLPGHPERLLINPFGLLFDEVTASSLVEIDLEGRAVAPDDARLNRAGLLIHTAIHAARPDAACVIHLHGEAGVAVSAQEEGLLPLTQTALFVLPDLAYHDYEGVAIGAGERERLVRDLGDARFLILRNHGTLVLGASVAEAFLHAYALERACRAQVLAQSAGAPLRRVSPDVGDRVPEQSAAVAEKAATSLPWPALLRRLDRESPGYRL